MRVHFAAFFALLALLALPVRPASATPDPGDAPALARTRALIQAFEAVPPPEEAGPGDPRRERTFETMDGFLDLEALTEEPIRPHWDRFTDEERRRFLQGFRDLVRRIVYPDSGAFFRDAAVDIGQPRRAEGGVVIVPLDTRLPDEGLRSEVDLHWRHSAGGLRLVDVAFDGDSVVQDYRNQFARILGKEGVEGLLRRLEDKRDELTRKGR